MAGLDFSDRGQPANGVLDFSSRGRPKVSTGEDVSRSAQSGLYSSIVQALPNPADIPLRMIQQAAKAGSAVMDALHGDFSGFAAPTEASAPGSPFGEILTKLAHQDYTPQTTAGKWAKTAGAMAPAALAPGSVVQRAANVILPTIGSEGAAQIAHGFGASPTVENAARFAGGLAGGLAASVRVAPKAVPMPAEDASAMQYVDRVAAKTPLEQVAAAADNVTGAEALGQPGKAALGALARRPGATGDALNAEVTARQIGRPGRLLDAFANVSGVSPEAAAGDIQALVEAGRAKAKPLYDQAYEMGPMESPKLADLMRRPVMKAAMQKARNLAANEGENPDALSLVDVEDPNQWATEFPTNAAETASPVRGPAKPPAQGPSLVKFLADNGGVADVNGDLAGMDAGAWHKGKAYQKPLIGTGSADDQALRAWEAGYFPNMLERPTINDLHDAIRSELRGKPIYAKPVDQAAMDRFNGREAADEMAYYGHSGEPTATEDAYGARPMPTSEPAYANLPTAKTWDYIKRGLDDVVDSYRDSTTGKIRKNNEVRSVLDTVSQLRKELTGINPAYKDALAVSSDYLSAEDAFNSAQKDIFNSNLTERQFADKLTGLSEGSKQAYKGGIANRFYDLAQNGRLDPKVLKTPRVQAKLKLALGPDAAAKLIDLASREGDMLGFERRYAPGANSITQEMSAAMADQDAVGPGAQMMGDFASGVVKGHGLRGAGLGAISRQIQTAMDALGPTRGMSVAVRDKAGQTLMLSPQELAAAIKAYRELPRSPMIGLKPGAGLLVGGAASARARQ